MTKDRENELIKQVNKVVDQIDNPNTFDVHEILKLFKGLGVSELNIANAQVTTQFYKRCAYRQIETKRFLDVSETLLSLTVDLSKQFAND